MMLNVKRCILLLLIFCCVWVALAAQQEYHLRLVPLDASLSAFPKQVEIDSIHTDSAAVFSHLKSIVNQLHQQSFIEASVDTVSQQQDSIFVAFLHLGPAYEWQSLNNSNVPEPFLKKAGFRSRLYQERPFSQAQLLALLDAILVQAENNGYPFAKVQLEDIHFEGNLLSASIVMEKGPLILIDSLRTNGNATISKAYLSNYLGLQSGTPYSKKQIIKSRDRLRELPFIKPQKDPNVVFSEDKATVNLYLEKKKASVFDFLIGVLPNSNQTGRLLVTGTFNGELQNQFGAGERIFARFEQLRPLTQELQLQFNYPYVLNTPFGADFNFELYRRDTNYITLQYDLGIQYLLEGGNYIKAFWNNAQTNLLSVDTSAIIQAQQLPDTLDVRYSSFGLSYLWSQLDYRLNPRSGFRVKLRANAGVKQISRNNTIASSEQAAVYYDSVSLRTFQYQVQGTLEGYIPLMSRSTIKGAIQAGFTFSEQPIYANEQYRIGGTQLLRGFDEESVFATRFAVFTVEYRLLLGQNSFLYTFFDYAYLDSETINITENTIDYPLGFGAGISFETRAGIFGVSLAYGRQKQNPIDFGAPKVHFGYISLF